MAGMEKKDVSHRRKKSRRKRSKESTQRHTDNGHSSTIKNSTVDPSSSPTRKRHRHHSSSPSATTRKHKSHHVVKDQNLRPITDTTSLVSGREKDHVSICSSQTLPSQYLRNVIYYQNRFIVLDSPTRKPRGRSSSGNLSTDDHGRKNKRTVNRALRKLAGSEATFADDSFGDSETSVSRGPGDGKSSGKRRRKHMDKNSKSVTMETRKVVPEIRVSDADGFRNTKSNKEKSILKRIAHVLMDDRVKGRPAYEIDLQNHPEKYRLLRKSLNVILVTVGVALLVAVCIVIIYTAIGEEFFVSSLKTLVRSFIVSLFIMINHVSSLM